MWSNIRGLTARTDPFAGRGCSSPGEDMNRLFRTGPGDPRSGSGPRNGKPWQRSCYVRTSSGSDSGFTADRAIGSGRCSVASSANGSFKDCVRLGSLADGANGALNLRAPSLNSVGGSCGRLGNPTGAAGEQRTEWREDGAQRLVVPSASPRTPRRKCVRCRERCAWAFETTTRPRDASRSRVRGRPQLFSGPVLY